MGTDKVDRSADGQLAGELLGRSHTVSHNKFRCRRGYDLHTTTYTPAVRRTDACLVFHHGLSDHSERHSGVLSHLCTSLGMPVYTYDAHGHGRSGPDGPTGRALIRRFDHMVDDLIDFTRQFVAPAEQEALASAEAVTAGQLAAAVAEEERRKGGAPGEEQGAEEGGVEEEAEDGIDPGSDVSGSSGFASGFSSSSADSGDGRSALFLQRPRRRWGSRPRVFLLGYSMGGLTCSLAVATTSTSNPASSSCDAPPSRAASAFLDPPPSSSDASASVASDAGPPSCLPSFSAAGAAAAAAASSSSSLYEGLMLTSALTDPLFGDSLLMRIVKVLYATALAALLPALPVFKRKPVESGIRDPAAVLEMASDALWYRGRFKAATVASLLWGCLRLRWLARRICLPLYVQHATVDTACSLPSMRAFLGRVSAACRDVTFHVVQGGFHDLHHDPETPLLKRRMVEWLAARV